MVKMQSVVPVLRMFDIARTREFYLDFLGFRVDWEHQYEPQLPLYLQISLGDVRLHLSEHYGDGSPGTKALLNVEGLSEYREMLLAKQTRFARPHMVQEPWGSTTMTVHDPSSNRLVFSESN